MGNTNTKGKGGWGKGYTIGFRKDNNKWILRIFNRKEGKWKSSGNYSTKEEALTVVRDSQ